MLKVVDYCEGSYLEPGANKREVSAQMPTRVSMAVQLSRLDSKGGGRSIDWAGHWLSMYWQ